MLIHCCILLFTDKTSREMEERTYNGIINYSYYKFLYVPGMWESILLHKKTLVCTGLFVIINIPCNCFGNTFATVICMVIQFVYNIYTGLIISVLRIS